MKPIYFFKKIVMQHYIALEHQVLREQEGARAEFLHNIEQAIHLRLAQKEVSKLQEIIDQQEQNIKIKSKLNKI